ncbi:c-type cytochrome [Steroidobacter flavus]|uniref:C-type cytochrome n=1 Tax=Steroidobacter flavus TaxID=1842136 RepID=A0ABV8SSL5_9GAMM
MNRVLRSAVFATLLAPALALVAAQASEPANVKELQKARHDHYHELGDSFKVIRDQIKTDKPDLAAIKSAAKVVNDASVNQEKWFPAGSGPEAGKTQAKAEIWSKPAEFKTAIKNFADAAPKLQTAANSGDVAAIKTAFADTGKTCKGCHETFRAEEH